MAATKGDLLFGPRSEQTYAEFVRAAPGKLAKLHTGTPEALYIIVAK